jgi:hypothetical protein
LSKIAKGDERWCRRNGTPYPYERGRRRYKSSNNPGASIDGSMRQNGNAPGITKQNNNNN